ncbi:GTPase HflX [Gaopeijia maritima]|uniref:GTPase HflX n=1 Tax=Gaopeijia maritima TaxID=3119007 RepID=A0ABU9EDV8_9BACT
MSAPPRELDPRIAEEHLEELARLTDTAGGQVTAVVRQRLDSPSPKTFIGQGKAEELKQVVESSGADLVIFDEELSPAQGKNLEQVTGVRVMDRPELILDIFATRARSKEARMQVELAQLEYLLPRLKRMWSHLSRTRGGIGLRGPGETQLETDRRLIGTRIADLRKKLRDVARAREIQRQSRQGEFRAALVGYTNAGKSSLLRALSGSEVFVEDRLFATLDSTTRTVELGDGYDMLVTDTVGFIRKLPHHLVASFRSTLEEAREADVLLHVIDSSHPDREEQEEVVAEVLADLELDDRPQVLVYNKIDRLTHAEESAIKDRIRAFSSRPAVFVSAHQPETLGRLRDALKARMRARLHKVRIELPARDGEALALLYRQGEVIERDDRGATIEVVVRVPDALLGRLRQRPGLVLVEGGEE